MSIILDGVELSGSLQWVDQFESSSVEQSVKRTLGGALVVFNAPLVAGRPITLVATEDTGWITYAMLEALLQRAAVSGATYSLEVHGFTANVMFRHSDAPAVSFEPLIPKAVNDPDRYFVGTVKFLTF